MALFPLRCNGRALSQNGENRKSCIPKLTFLDYKHGSDIPMDIPKSVVSVLISLISDMRSLCPLQY